MNVAVRTKCEHHKHQSKLDAIKSNIQFYNSGVNIFPDYHKFYEQILTMFKFVSRFILVNKGN